MNETETARPRLALRQEADKPAAGKAEGAKLVRPSYYRMMMPGPVLRSSEDPKVMPTMVGHFCVFNRWTHIDSFWEGEFMESVAKGATVKTIKENKENMKVLFNHGRDAAIGNLVLGPPEVVREDYMGTAFEVPLLDTDYNQRLLPGLALGSKNGGYGTSFRFRVMAEEVVAKPGRSDYNPEGIEERVIKEMEVMEFGPVTFPQYTDASVELRSLTDDFLRKDMFDRIASQPEQLIALLGRERWNELLHSIDPALLALSNGRAEDKTSLAGGSRTDVELGFRPLVVVRNPNKAK
ncbi:MAG: HK97 family phage prohead protease [Candidatus Dormibacteria bacterium]